jgi:L-alanine-DL-glutamate epimerase-like enolase superfamily enzyme
MSGKPGIRVLGVRLFFLPVATRIPLKFGPEVTTRVTCARVEATIAGPGGRPVTGWGETPLSVVWMWPSALSYAERDDAMRALCGTIAREMATLPGASHPLEFGHLFAGEILPGIMDGLNRRRAPFDPLPWLAALGCFAPFDIALHDAYAKSVDAETYRTYDGEHLDRDLAWFFGDAERELFAGRRPDGFLAASPARRLPAWHLVGGTDLLARDELTGGEPDDGHPVLLPDWIRRDGLHCLKVKLCGDDGEWDWRRLLAVGGVAIEHGVRWLCADFNCMVRDPAYVIEILDRLRRDHPRLWDMILYLEQPFPYDLHSHPIDVSGIAKRKPLFMDESAHDWRHVAMGRELGWTGVALKTCKTQTGAILSLCWARAHGMHIMVQDLTNPMLAQIAHLQLAAHAGTIMGVETNAMQFYPDASLAEAAVHPGAFRRVDGHVDTGSFRGPGFGYRIEEIARELPSAEDSGHASGIQADA